MARNGKEMPLRPVLLRGYPSDSLVRPDGGRRREDKEDDVLTRIISALSLGLWVGVASAAAAADLDADTAGMERKVRGLGIAIGEAFACMPEKKRDGFKEEAHHLFDLIVQDVGSDLAYTYATAIGIGSTHPKAKIDCTKRLRHWEEIREDYELKGDE